MKLINMAAVVLAGLAFGLASNPALAQETQTKQAAEHPSHSRFVKLAEGVQVLRLFQTKVPKGGEVAILRLSKDQYKRFKEDPKRFVNETYAKKIFRFEVTDVIQATYKGQDDLDDANEVEIVFAHNLQWIVPFVAIKAPEQ